MYKHGFDFPHFAVYELLKDPKAVEALEDMYRRYFDVVAAHGMSALVGGFDYRASPDWGTLLGYSARGLSDVTVDCIEFLLRVAAPYADDIDHILIQGLVGPRGDAYDTNETITDIEAQGALNGSTQHLPLFLIIRGGDEIEQTKDEQRAACAAVATMA